MASTSRGFWRGREGKEKHTGKANANLELHDVMCPICLCILIEPVTMPCKHDLCFPCFQQHVQETSLQCPVCRKRISSWSRKATREKTLINGILWKRIQKEFPDKVKRRQEGNDSLNYSSDNEFMDVPHLILSQPGEIRKEYEAQLKRLQEESEREHERENQQSTALIKAIQEEDAQAQRLVEKDHMIALLIGQKIQEEPAALEEVVVNSVLSNIDEVLRPTSHCAQDANQQRLNNRKRPFSCCGAITAAGADLPSCSQVSAWKNKKSVKSAACGKKEEKMPEETPERPSGKLSRSNSVDSDDSITPELRHFRPIKSAPKTPPLRLPDGRFKETPLIHATPRTLTFDLNQPDRNDLLRRRLTTIEDDRRRRLDMHVNVAQAEIPHPGRKLNLFRPLGLFSTSPGNCSQGSKPDLKFAPSTLAANKENPIIAGRKRKLPDTAEQVMGERKRKGLGQAFANVPGKSKLPRAPQSPKPQVPEPSKPQLPKQPPSKALLLEPHMTKAQVRKIQLEALSSRKQEDGDRRLAIRLQKELNSQSCKSVVDRRVGTAGEYFLRSRHTDVSFRFNATATT